MLALRHFQMPQLALQTVDPLLADLASTMLSLALLVVISSFQGGLLAMADEALDVRTSLGTFVAEGRSHYLAIPVAYLLVVAVNLVLSLVVGFTAIVGGLAAYAAPAASVTGRSPFWVSSAGGCSSAIGATRRNRAG